MTGETADATRREILSSYDQVREQLSRAVHCQHLGADLTQEAYYRALRFVSRREPPHNSQAWFRAIAWNVVRTCLRKKAVRAAHESLDETTVVDERGGDFTCEGTSFDVDLERLARAIESLSPISQALIVGFYFEGKGCRELGELFGMRHSNVKCRLYRARKRIRLSLLGPDEVRHE